MQLDDMRIFVATVDAHNFTAAARRLALSKQFVSRRVMALEEALGVQLLIRNTRKLAVTELGQEFYERARRILGEVEDAEQAMSLRRAGPRGLLRVSAPMSFGMMHLSPLVAEFLREHGDVRFDMELRACAGAVCWLAWASVDLLHVTRNPPSQCWAGFYPACRIPASWL